MSDYLTTHPDEMDFFEAYDKDKRTFCVCLLNKIAKKEIIINTFIKEETVECPLKIIILTLYFHFFFVFFAVKMSFWRNDIQKIYDVEKEEYLMFFLKEVLFNSLFSFVMASIIRNVIDLFLSDKMTIKKVFKRKQLTWQTEDEIKQVIKCIKIRYSIFLILDVLVMISSWVYVSCFNVVFPNTTSHWIFLCLACFLSDEVIYIILAFLETCIRLMATKCKVKCLFTFSIILNKI